MRIAKKLGLQEGPLNHVYYDWPIVPVRTA
jgi:hypothetical protein